MVPGEDGKPDGRRTDRLAAFQKYLFAAETTSPDQTCPTSRAQRLHAALSLLDNERRSAFNVIYGSADLKTKLDAHKRRCDATAMEKQLLGRHADVLNERVRHVAREAAHVREMRNQKRGVKATMNNWESELELDDLLEMMTLGAPSRATPVDFSTLKVAENVWPKVAMRRKASSAVSATSNDTTPRGVGRDITCVIPTDLGTADTARQQQTATSMRATHGRPAPNHLPGDHAHNALPARLEARVITDEEGDDAAQNIRGGDNFMSGAQKLARDNAVKNRHRALASDSNSSTVVPRKRRLGTSGAVNGNRKPFVSPMLRPDEQGDQKLRKHSNACPTLDENGMEDDDRLKNLDPKMVEMIRNEILTGVSTVYWDDIAGLDLAKKTIMEVVVYPMLRPDIFTGLRAPPKGLLLFGPPGTGKTMIGKCIASQCKASFFNISSSALTSKWIGEGEKMVRTLFAVARVEQPSVIFIDEIDSLLTARTEGEHEATRRVKTEFLIQFDGCGTDNEDRILLIGATNRPAELDEAARRRFRKKLYIALPEAVGRRKIVDHLLVNEKHSLTTQDVDRIVELTDGYSGSDMHGLVSEAVMGPVRDCPNLIDVNADDMRPISFEDFEDALTQVRPSVSANDLLHYLKFDQEHGSTNRR